MNFLKFTWKEYRLQILISVLVFGGLIAASIYRSQVYQKIDWIDPIIGLGTLAFIFFLWINNLGQSWQNNLPKRITVSYRWNGRDAMLCTNALLTSESDARTWALQIGQQMSGCQRLKFSPFFTFKHIGIKKNPKSGELYNAYFFVYYLNEIPVPDHGTDEEKEKFRKKIENGYIEWVPNYKDDSSVTFEEIYFPSTKQIIPTS